MKTPLAVRMRPTTLDDIVGQQHIIGKDKPLRKMIEADYLPSMILYGPPGTGKTTIASVIANTTNSDFIKVNAVSEKKKDLENAIDRAEKNLKNNTSTILFIDEIHRFNKTQQDYLLPYVENKVVSLIGATTENPFFEVNGALTSRSLIFQLQPVSIDDIKTYLQKALNDPIIAAMNKTISDETLYLIAEQANGDVRHALQLLEMSFIVSNTNEVTNDVIKDLIQKPNMLYDKDGDKHYDTISAFIKSMRGSDPNATMYYLAKMIESGEDPKFIARRIMIHASEDVGLANPMAICVAVAAALEVERVGMPEGRIALAHAALTIALSPKSNSSCMSIDAALQYIKDHPQIDQPNSMKDCHYKSAAKLGHGTGYKYPHDYPNHWVPQQYLPDAVAGTQFYFGSDMGDEKAMLERMQNIIKYAAEHLDEYQSIPSFR